MIEMLFDEERQYGEPVFSLTTAQIVKVRETVRTKASPLTLLPNSR